MNDDEWWDDDEPIWFIVGSGEGQDVPETPRFKSVSPAAHRAFEIGKRMQERPRRPVGFHRPPVRCR
jgi:hypothetical protein